jgi:hypothetical protein
VLFGVLVDVLVCVVLGVCCVGMSVCECVCVVLGVLGLGVLGRCVGVLVCSVLCWGCYDCVGVSCVGGCVWVCVSVGVCMRVGVSCGGCGCAWVCCVGVLRGCVESACLCDVWACGCVERVCWCGVWACGCIERACVRGAWVCQWSRCVVGVSLGVSRVYVECGCTWNVLVAMWVCMGVLYRCVGVSWGVGVQVLCKWGVGMSARARGVCCVDG